MDKYSTVSDTLQREKKIIHSTDNFQSKQKRTKGYRVPEELKETALGNTIKLISVYQQLSCC